LRQVSGVPVGRSRDKSQGHGAVCSVALGPESLVMSVSHISTREAIMALINNLVGMAALMFGAIVLPCTAFAEMANDAIGTWTFVSSINEQNGRKSETYGPGATGVMILDSGARYAITIIAAGLPKFASNNRSTATAEEAKVVIARSNAHFGT